MRITEVRTAALAVSVLCLLVSAQVVRAEQASSPAEPDMKRYKEYARFDIALPGSLPDGNGVTLHLGHHGEGGFRQAWATVDGGKVISDAVDATALSLKDGRVKGKVEIAELRDGSESGLACEFELDAAVDGGKVTGTYRGWTADRLVDGKNIVYLGKGQVHSPDQVRWKRDDRQDVSGKLTGRMRDAATTARHQAFATSRGWPYHRGPNHDWSAEPCNNTLIDDMRQARFVWKSETTPPARSQVTRYGEGNVVRYLERGLAGGGASPQYANGKVYFHYYEPTGDAYSKGTVAGQITRGRHTIVDMWKTNAKDVVLCLDAATGRTLWKADIPGGRYYPSMSGRMGSTKGWYAPHLAIAEGRVFLSTTSDVTYCLDAGTGQTKWSRKMPMAAIRTVIDGVLLPSGRDLIGYDAATGKKLWRKEYVNSGVRAPLRWRHKGKDYAIAGYDRGHWRENKGGVICFEPKTGKELWRIQEGLGKNADSLHIDGDVLFANVQTERKAPGQVGAFRLSLEGAEKIWELPEKHVYGAQNRPLISNDGLLLLRHNDKSGKAVIAKIETGEIVKELQFPKARGFLYRVGDRLILQRDVSHSKTPLYMYSFRMDNLRQMGEVWPTLHTPTSGYWPITISHAIADGRMFIRGSRGIFCYDLRRTPAPAFDPPGKKTSQPVTLKLTHPDPKATIRYAFDGNVPTRHSPVYDKPLKITETRIVKARAWHPVYAPSEVARAVVYFGESDKAQPPKISPRPDTYERDVTVTLSTPTKYATIGFTLDGSEPTRKSPVYDKPFVLARSATLKAKTFCSYLPDSETVSASYRLQRRPFLEEDGRFVLEAESFFTQKQADTHEWKIVDAEKASGKLIDATPDTGKKYKRGKGPRLDYPLLVEKAGTYHVWVRWRGSSSSSDSLYVGLDRRVAGEFGNHAGPLKWERLGGAEPKPVTVSKSGQHTFHIWMREDGSTVDKVMLTRDADWTPEGAGPQESPRRDSD